MSELGSDFKCVQDKELIYKISGKPSHTPLRQSVQFRTRPLDGTGLFFLRLKFPSPLCGSVCTVA